MERLVTYRRHVFFGLLAVCILLGLVLLAQPVSAQAGPVFARWKLKVTFDNNLIVPVWTVQVLSDSQVLQQREITGIPCVQSGNVVINGDRARFNSGSFECTTGDFRAEVLQLTNGQLDIGQQCTASDTWVRLKGRPDFVAATNQPMFAIPDGPVRMNWFGTAVNQKVAAWLQVGPMVTGGPFTLGNGDNLLGIRLHDCNVGSDCNGKLRANGTLEVNEQVPYTPGTTIPTHPIPVLIGSDGINQYTGDLVMIEIDPPCSGIASD